MHKRTIACSLSKSVKETVHERDGHCIYCGKPGNPDAHYVPRSKGGLGIEENVIELCGDCHRRYDQSVEHASMREFFREYLKLKYKDWNESKLVYRKW